MCVGDWRIGTHIRSVITKFTVTSGSRDFPANQNRVGLMVFLNSVTGTGPIQFKVDDVTVGSILQGLGGPPFYVNLKDHGDLSTRKFTFYNTAGTMDVSIIEFIAPTGLIASGLKEFLRSYPGTL